MSTPHPERYVLGHEQQELIRLDRQAAAIDRPTRLLLQAAGLMPGMRVLDLGTGLGHVARIAGDLVGPTGTVIGIDRATAALTAARDRARADGVAHVTFVEADAATWITSDPFDAIVSRLVLFHLPDPAAAVRHHLQNLRPGGVFAAVEFDMGGARTEPPVPLVDEVIGWVRSAFRAAGAWPEIGARLGVMLSDEGLQQVVTFGVQAYLSGRHPDGAAQLTGVAKSLAPVIVDRGIASATALDVATLEQRIADAVRAADAVILPPAVVGAWGRRT